MKAISCIAHWLPLLPGVALLLWLSGCGRAGSDAAQAHTHEHLAPHGGALAVLGDEAYHLELVLDAASGQLDLYVLDGEAEGFVRIPQLEVVLEITREGDAPQQPPVTARLDAVGNPATGETPGDTSQFSATVPSLQNASRFDAAVKVVTIRGTRFENVAIRFPEGSDAHHHHHDH